MENNYKSENEIEQTLNSLQGIESAEPSPFFYSRLKARMEKELLTPKKVLGWQVKPIYAYSVLAIILIINTFTIVSINEKPQNPSSKEVYSLYNADGI